MSITKLNQELDDFAQLTPKEILLSFNIVSIIVGLISVLLLILLVIQLITIFKYHQFGFWKWIICFVLIGVLGGIYWASSNPIPQLHHKLFVKSKQIHNEVIDILNKKEANKVEKDVAQYLKELPTQTSEDIIITEKNGETYVDINDGYLYKVDRVVSDSNQNIEHSHITYKKIPEKIHYLHKKGEIIELTLYK